MPITTSSFDERKCVVMQILEGGVWDATEREILARVDKSRVEVWRVFRVLKIKSLISSGSEKGSGKASPKEVDFV